MRVVGANIGITEKGMLLNDGGVCLIDNGKIVIVAEERISRKKYDGGFTQGLKKILEKNKLSIDDIDLFVFSSCCELPRKNYHVEGIPDKKIRIIPSHHLSHAYSTYYSSGFEEAIIMVIDNEGNIINDLGKENFYENELEHMTYYIGKSDKVIFHSRDEVDPKYIGIGDAYRYFTNYLGFPSYVYAGKTMGLAPYGDRNKYKHIKIFEFNESTGKITCRIKNNYKNSSKSIKDFFHDNYNMDIIEPRTPIDDITKEYEDLAFLIQDELEEVLIKKVKYLVKETGIKNICIAGGVGLNCVANGRILKECNIDNIFIIPAAGDTGECLGNAYYGYYDILKQTKKIKFKSPFLGFKYTNDEILIELKKYDNIEYKKYEDMNKLNKEIAKELANNKIIGRFEGQSEFGPRALGNRSILMSPIDKNNKDILNSKVKFRESFRPFAPSVLYDYASEYFDLQTESPYMLLAVKVLKKDKIPAVTHVDNTARVQTVRKEDNKDYYDLINEFYYLTDVPVILNTSFNLDGQPIVETPKDAIDCFVSTNIDVLMIGNYIVRKK